MFCNTSIRAFSFHVNKRALAPATISKIHYGKANEIYPRAFEYTTITITTTGATVSWTAGENNGSNFEVEYGLQGFAHGEGTAVQVSATSYTLSGLSEETSYDVYVRALCADDNYSEWSTVTTFTTLEEVGINSIDINDLVVIYPNPAENNTTIRVSGVEGEVTVTIVDMNGRTISSYTMACGGDCEKMMNVEGLAAGNYFVRLQGNGLNTVKKLIVK